MKTKIFWSVKENPEEMETEMNDFFRDNPNIEIIDKLPLANKSVFWLIVTYKENIVL